jgi:hypothetical protein
MDALWLNIHKQLDKNTQVIEQSRDVIEQTEQHQARLFLAIGKLVKDKK